MVIKEIKNTVLVLKVWKPRGMSYGVGKGMWLCENLVSVEYTWFKMSEMSEESKFSSRSQYLNTGMFPERVKNKSQIGKDNMRKSWTWLDNTPCIISAIVFPSTQNVLRQT